MGINVIFNDSHYDITLKQKEAWDRYCKIIQWGRREPVRFIEDFIGLQLTDYQKMMICGLWMCRTGVILCSRNTGKATSLDTKVYKSGEPHYTTVGELKVGDKIYDSQGKLSEVIHLNPVIFDDYYIVEFDDGEKIKCNGEHLWLVHDRDFHKSTPDINKYRLLNTDYIYHHFNRGTKKRNDYTFHVPLNKPIQYAKSKNGYLPIDPYVLGYYLGDGCTISGVITCGAEDIENTVENLKACSKVVTYRKDKGKQNVYVIKVDFEQDLKKAGYQQPHNQSLKSRLSNCEDLLHDKHIPEQYLFSSVENRLALLQGLFDSDACCDDRGTCEFSQSNKKIAEDVCWLIRSLGMKATLTRKIKKDGTEADTWRVYFAPSKEMPVFRLKRKLDKLPEHPSTRTTRKAIVNVTRINEKIPMRCITMRNDDGTFLCGEYFTVTHNSFVTAPYIASRSLLFPNHKTYIISNTSAQSAETFGKLRQLAEGAIGSAIGLSSVFLENCSAANSKVSPFLSGKDGCSVALFNGSEVHSLPAAPENIRGYRSSCTIFDEAAFMPKTLFDAALPFASQNKDFMTGKGLNTELLPKGLPNQNILLSSASDINSEMYSQYKEGFKEMLLGNTEYFVMDLDWHISTAPFMNGKPMPPLVSPEVVQAAYKTDIFRAEQEYGNIWSGESGPDCLVTRATLERISSSYYPVFKNEGGKTYILAFDPSAKIDSAVIGVGELYRDADKGLMLKIVNVRSLLEVLGNGEKVVIQRPEQIEILKEMICNYNDGSYDFDAIDQVIIDSGGGGFEIGQFLMNEWTGPDGKTYNGFIDENDEYMKIRIDDGYQGNSRKLKLFSFKKNKTSGYEHCQQMLNQGLVKFSKDLNARNEIEFELENEDGQMLIRYEKPSLADMDALIQISLCKTELMNMQKQKKPNGNVIFDLSPQAKSKNGHDDHCDVIMMLCDRLFELRANEALDKETPTSDFSKVYGSSSSNKKKNNNPFVNGANPFSPRGFNPFS